MANVTKSIPNSWYALKLVVLLTLAHTVLQGCELHPDQWEKLDDRDRQELDDLLYTLDL